MGRRDEQKKKVGYCTAAGGGRRAVSKFWRAVIMKITIKETK